IVQAYSSSATFSWSTTGDPAGTYLYTVWGRDASSIATLDAYFPGTAYTLASTATPCTAVTATAAPASPQVPGTAAPLSGAATGCPNPRYQFWILPPGGTWTIVQTYSSNAAFSWSTTGDPAGTYLYTVWARDASSTANLDTYSPGTGYTLISTATPCSAVTASATPASPQLPGTAATLSGSASGCPNPRYQFWIMPPG